MLVDVVVVSRWLGKASEPWLYRQVSRMTRYRPWLAVEGHLNQAWYPFDRVTEMAPAVPWKRRWLRLRRSLRAGRWLDRDLLKQRELGELLERCSPQLVHVHFLWNHYALGVPSGASVPVVFTAHGSDVMQAFTDSAYRDDLQVVFHDAAAIIAVSDFIAQRLEALGCAKEKIRVLRLGVPVPVSRNNPACEGQSLQLISVGSLVPIKGHGDLLTAFALAHDQRQDLRLTIVGDGPQRALLEAQVAEAGLLESVQFTGVLPEQEVAALLAQSDVYVQMGASLPNSALPEWPAEEALGISYVEAAAHGLPLLGTQTGGVPEICRPGQTGLLASPGDVRGMADNILRLAAEQTLRTGLGREGRALVEREFDVVKQTARLEAFYDEVIGAGGTAA